MKCQIIFVFLYVCLLFYFENATAQFSNIKFEHLTIKNGLSYNSVHCIFRDHNGYLWIGTQKGLNRFDGTKIKVFKNKLQDEKSLSNNDIFSIYEDSKQNLWIGTTNGLNLFDNRTETFKHFLTDSANIHSISNNFIATIIEDKSGNLWINTHDGINKWIDEKQSFERYYPPGSNNKLRPIYVDKICCDSQNNIWGTRNNKLWKFNTQNKQFQTFTDKLIESAFKEETVLSIDNNGIIWIGTRANGLFSFNPNSNKFTSYNHKSDGKGTNCKMILDLHFDGRYLFIATEPGGINRLDPQTNSFDYCNHNEDKENGLRGTSVWCIYNDKEKILYAGSPNGLNINNPKKDRFNKYNHTIKDSNSLINNSINVFFEDSKGLIWIGTPKGISVFNPKNEKFTNYSYTTDDRYGLSGNNVLCFAEDKHHDVWIGTWENGLNRFDRETGRFFHYSADSNYSHNISFNSILDLFVDDKGHIWLSYFPTGIDVFDINKGVIKKYRHNPSDSGSLPNTWIDCFKIRNDGKLGLVTPKGYGIYDFKKELFLWDKTFDGIHLLDVYDDKQGNYWVSTWENGLWKVLIDDKIEKFDEINEISLNTVGGVIEDSNDNIWIASDLGLTKYNPITKKFKHFTEEDGLISPLSVIFKSINGNIYCGGTDGFCSFNPDSIRINSFLPNVYIDEFQIFNKSINQYSQNSPLKNTISETTDIELSYNNSVFSFGFTAINMTNPEKAIYAYMMLGFDKEWIFTNSANRKATYTNLDAGDYLFMVKATNNDGIWNESSATIKIKITPPWWKTIWFRVLIIFMIIGSALAFYFIRISALKRYQRILENKVRKRTLELQETNIILEEQKEELIQQYEVLNELNNTKDKLFSIIAHDLRTPFTLIVGYAEMLIEKVDKYDSRKIKQVAQSIFKSTSQIFILLENLLEWAKIQRGQLLPDLRLYDIKKIADEVVIQFSEMALNKSVTITNKISSRIMVNCDKNMTYTILRNLISNALKFTNINDFVTIDARKYNSIIEILVTDSGIGIPQEKIDRLFRVDKSISTTGTANEKGTGLGLLLCIELVEKQGGQISVMSDVGKGSTFFLKFPLKNNGQLTMDNEELPSEGELIIDNGQLTIDNEEIPSEGELTIILVVDDSLEMRTFIKSKLQNLYSIIEASDGKEGFEKTIELNPSLIISDVMMPGIDGLEFCSNIKNNELTSHIPLILLTAQNSEESTIEGFGAGADDYITKPFSANILKSRIKTILQNRERLRKLYSQQIIVEPNKITLNPTDEKFMDKVIQVVEKNIDNPEFSVVMLADKVSVTPKTLLRKINSVTGENVNDFISTMRMKKAAHLLIQTDRSISEIAYIVGFSSPEYFTKCFKNKFSKTPSQYRD